MDQAFEFALQKIHPLLREETFRFVPILNGHKKPEGKSWSTKANYPFSHPVLAGYLAQGHNYGVLTGVGGLVVLDVDDLPRLEALGTIDKLPETFIVRTGRGGLHFYFICPELKDKIILEDPEMQDIEGDPLHLGELQALGQQVVGPGSIHPNGNRYEVVKDLPIVHITKNDLLQILAPLKQTNASEAKQAHSARRRTAGGSSLGDLIPIDEAAWPKDIKERAGSEVRGAHPLHGSTSGKNFAVNTSKNCWYCFRHKSGGGPLEWLAVEAGLISCQDAKSGCLDDKELFKKVLQIAQDRGFDIPDQVNAAGREEKPTGPTVLDALQKLLENEEKIKGECSWNWRLRRGRIKKVLRDGHLSRKQEEKAHKFLKQFNKILHDLGIDYDDLHPLLSRPNNKEEFSQDIRSKALDILKTGDPMKFIVESCSETVEGAETAIKKLLCCVSVQNIRQSAGLHPKLNGDSSGGKTFTVYTFAHHMPKEAVIKGSMSAKAGFYHNDGNRVFRILDDYQAGNEDLDTVIKQTSSEFHAPYQHRTVANHAAVVMEIGSEQTWAITSVDSSQEIQVLNRQLPININDSAELTEKVNKKTIERYSAGGLQFPLSENVLISRCIIQILRDEGYIDVRIPFGNRITWLDKSNRRNPAIFMDLLIAFTAINRYQRARDSEGYYLATEDDFRAAKALFADNDAEELVKRLTKKERETLDFMIERPDGITQDELAEHLNVSRQRAGQILYGQKGAGGLVGKIPIKETKLSEMLRINDDESRTVHKTVYSLKEYDRLAGFDAIVRLEPETAEPCKSGKEDASKGASMETASGKEDASIESQKEKEEERRDDSPSSSVDESISSLENGDHTFNTCAISPNSVPDTCGVLAGDLQDLHSPPKPAGKGKSTDPASLEKLRIIKQDGYRTQIPLPNDPCKFVDHLFDYGEIAEFQHWKAVDLIKRGIAEPVEARS